MSLFKKIKKLVFANDAGKKKTAMDTKTSDANKENSGSKPKKSRYVKLVAEKNGLDYDEAYARMREIKEKYGISFYVISKRDMINKSEKEIAEFAEREKKRYNQRLEIISAETGKTIEEVIEEVEEVKKIYNISFKKYFFNRLYLLDEDELAAKVKSWEDEKTEFIETVMNESGWERSKVISHIKRCDINYGIDMLHYVLFRCWEMSEEEIAEYLTIKTSTQLTNKYNSTGRKYFINKDLFDEKFKDFIGRKHWVNVDTSFDEFESFAKDLDEIFIKPMSSSAGRGAEKVRIGTDLRALYDDLMARERIIAEECVRQHDDINKLFPDCVNTIRVITILKDDVCHVVFALIKIGNGGIVDNLVGGGMAAVIDINTGKIITNAVDIRGNIIENHPVTGTKINGYQIPNWEMLIETLDKAIRVVPDVNYVGWDVAIGQDKIMIIEGNSRPDLGLCQIPMVQKKKGIKHLFDEFLK